MDNTIKVDNITQISKVIIHVTLWISLLCMFFSYINTYSLDTVVYCNNLLQTSGLIQITQLVIYITAYIVMIIYLDQITKPTEKWLQMNSYDFITIIWTNLIGLWIVVGSNDFITLYIGIELQTLGAFILVALRKFSEYSIESALKYFILGALSSAILLLGIGLVYVSLGTTNYTNLASLMNNLTDSQTIHTLKIAYIFIIVSLLFKLGAAPFHNWVPDVYQGSATIVTTYFVTVPKIGIITALILILLNNVAVESSEWLQILIVSSILSMLVGTTGAINQYNMKRLLAFSAISHTGYLLIGVITNTVESFVSIVIYLIIYIIMSFVSWSILMNMSTVSTSSNKSNVIGDGLDSTVVIDNNEYHKTTQYQIKGLGRSQPIYAMLLSITFLSIAGIPPLAGFYTKWLLFSSAVQNGYVLVALIGIVTSVIGAVYYLRIVQYMYFRTPDSKYNELSDIVSIDTTMKLNTSIIISVSTLIVMILLFTPQVLVDIVTVAVFSVI